jgi:hypothetical protein
VATIKGETATVQLLVDAGADTEAVGKVRDRGMNKDRTHIIWKKLCAGKSNEACSLSSTLVVPDVHKAARACCFYFF